MNQSSLVIVSMLFTFTNMQYRSQEVSLGGAVEPLGGNK